MLFALIQTKKGANAFVMAHSNRAKGQKRPSSHRKNVLLAFCKSRKLAQTRYLII